MKPLLLMLTPLTIAAAAWGGRLLLARTEDSLRDLLSWPTDCRRLQGEREVRP